MRVGNYERLLENREYDVDGISDWRWIKEDWGAWKGPIGDWVISHKSKYTEHVKKFDVVVQAGGNCGMYPRLFSKMFKWVYTFEPDPLNFFTLVQNCQEDNIVKFQAALGAENGMVDITRPAMNNVGMHRTSANPSANIPQFKLDNLALHDCDLIQLDIEGYELNALKGAVETIRKFKPVIAVERTNDQIKAFLTDLGYEYASTSCMDTVYRPTN